MPAYHAANGVLHLFFQEQIVTVQHKADQGGRVEAVRCVPLHNVVRDRVATGALLNLTRIEAGRYDQSQLYTTGVMPHMIQYNIFQSTRLSHTYLMKYYSTSHNVHVGPILHFLGHSLGEHRRRVLRVGLLAR